MTVAASTIPITAKNVERYLDQGVLYAEMRNGRWWRIRRNGQTKTWKTRPGEFRIPIKAGIRSHAYIEPTNVDKFKHIDDLPPSVRS